MRAIVLGAAIAAMTVGLTGCDDGKKDITITAAYGSAEERGYIGKAFKTFLEKTCQPLIKAWGKGYSAEGLIRDAYSYQVERWGWTQQVEVSVRRPTGDVEHYWLGAGHDPGIMILKQTSADTCGWNVSVGGENVLVQFDDMALVDDMPPAHGSALKKSKTDHQ